MATYSSNTGREYQLIVSITEAGSPDIPNNRSKLNWTVKLKQGQYRHNALCTYNLSINGVSVWASASGGTTINTSAYPKNTTITLASGTTGWITHNADGKKTVAISASYKTNNQTSGVVWICPLLSISGSFAITTIPRTSKPTLSSTSFNLGTEITISTNRASSGFTHTIRYAFGSASGTIATGVGTSTKWTPPLTLASQIPNAVSGTGYIYCDTYSGSTKIGTESVKFTGRVPASGVPTFTTITHSEYVADVASKVGAYVQGQSRLSLAITGAAGVYGSTIKSYSITFDGSSYGAQSAVSAVLEGSGTLTITGKVTDSRGRTTSKSVTVSVLPYAPPKITAFSLQRCTAAGVLDDLGTYVKVTRAGSISSLKPGSTEKNSLSYVIRSKARTATTWTAKKTGTGALTLTGSDVVGTYTTVTSADFRIEITDIFNTSISLAVLTTAAVTLSWGPEGVGIGKIVEPGRALDVAGSGYIDGHRIVYFGSYEDW